tara:strand:+ start:1607 stop:2701 length:1095 start_codon:yes stop_codon:yes gene_type:complete
MAEGFRRAGFATLAATDYDLMAGRTFRHNHGNVPFILRDISELDANELLSVAGVKSGEIDVICGGPPCQGFSLAGARLADDPRNQLFKEFVRIVDAVRPHFFMFENVGGLISMKGGAVLNAILNAFEMLGYSCSWRLVNAADFGVPQNRPRVIIIGQRGATAPTFPAATHGIQSDQTSLFESLLPYVTTWDALSDLPTIQQGQGGEELLHTQPPANSYQRDRRGHRKPGTVFNHRATSHSQAVINRYASIPEGGNAKDVPVALRTKKANYCRLASERPARTVTCNHRTDILHPKIPRGTTVREAARLQSFDDDYQFFGNLTRKAKYVTQDDQVGNAVPPLLAEAFARHLRLAIDSTRELSVAAE